MMGSSKIIKGFDNSHAYWLEQMRSIPATVSASNCLRKQTKNIM